MKIRYFILLFGITLALESCEIDNYDEPDSYFQGSITYEGEPIGVETDEVRFQLWQSGFGTEGPIDVHVAQDGSFSSLLFKGDYRLHFIPGQGPFKANVVNEQQGDTIYVNLNGDLTMDLEVTPFYMIRNATFDQSGGVVSGSASLEQIITTGDDAKSVERATLYLNDSRFVSNNSDENVANADADLTDIANLDVEVDIPSDYIRDYIFVRLGVKIAGVEDMIYTEVQRLEL